jgi:uncharacterized membrane protein
MNQVNALINSVGLVIIFGFVFCMVQMIISHIFKMKAIKTNNTESEHYRKLRGQLTGGLGFLLFFFLVALMIINVFQNWNSAGGSGILASEHPHFRRNVINETINVIRLLVIFTFVGVGTKFVLRFREQVAKLKIKESQEEKSV